MMTKIEKLNAVFQIILGFLLFALLIVPYALFEYEISIYKIYSHLAITLAFVLLPSAIGLIIYGLRSRVSPIVKGLIENKRKRFSRLIYLAASIIYYFCIVISIVFSIYVFQRGFGIIEEDLGPEVSAIIEIAIFGGLIILGIVGTIYLLSFLGKGAFLFIIMIQKRKAKVIRNYAEQSTQIGHFHKWLVIITLTIAVSGAGIANAIKPPSCNENDVSFSTPAYNLQLIYNSSHYNPLLDNYSLINQTLLRCLEKGLWAMTKTQHTGGFPMKMLTDGSEMYSDRGPGCPLFPDEFSLQGGTPLIAGTYLAMYKLDPNPVYLSVALKAADAIVAVQDQKNGGFYYDGRRHGENGTGYQPHPKNHRRSAVLDDNVMQGCLSFLLDIYNVTRDEKYLSAINKGFDCLKNMEAAGGGWPQRSNYEPNEYQSYITLNDECLRDVVYLYLKAYDIFKDDYYLSFAERAGQFLIRVQGNGNQGNSSQAGCWAQQYKNDQSAWARRFEPPAMCSRQTARSVEILIELYLYTGNTSYLAPIPKAIEWLNSSSTTIVNPDPDSNDFVWARLYELGTNKMIVGVRNQKTNVPYYYDYKPERDYGYGWIGTFGINHTLSQWEKLVDLSFNITEYKTWRDSPRRLASLQADAIMAFDKITNDGFWLDDDGLINDKGFHDNAMALINYLKTSISEQ
ncbi:MAG: pectate lyase [Promethearchaeota archaeon]